ncbi:hypothetical protein Gotur_033678 [Gossypium turneri]
MWRVNYHFGRRKFAIGIAGGRARSHRNINGGQIEMGWLRDTFLKPDDDSTELERI